MNKTAKSIVVLTSICLAIALLLSVVNSITDPIIKEHTEAETRKMYADILPGSTKLENIEFDKAKYPSVIKVSKDVGGAGYVFELSTNKGYTGEDIVFLMSVDNNGSVIKMSFSSYPESRGTADGFKALYGGKNLPLTDTIAGATIASNAIKDAVNEAFAIYSEFVKVEIPDIVAAIPLFDKIMPYAVQKNGGVGEKQIEIPANAPQSITGIATPSNETGYFVTAKKGDTVLVLGLNAFGNVFYMSDLNGKDLLSDSKYSDIISDAESLTSICEARKDNIIAQMISKEIISAPEDAETLDVSTINSNLIAAFKLEDGNAYVATAKGYGGLITACYVINTDGEIINYATLEHAEIDNSHSNEKYGTVIGFKDYADKLTELTVDSVTDDTFTIAGATTTTFATAKIWNDIKAAHIKITGEAK